MSDPPFPITWTPTARRALTRLPARAAAAAVELNHGGLVESPRRDGKQLRYELEGLGSARRGDFRIIHRITDVATVVAIDHRADVYRER